MSRGRWLSRFKRLSCKLPKRFWRLRFLAHSRFRRRRLSSSSSSSSCSCPSLVGDSPKNSFMAMEDALEELLIQLTTTYIHEGVRVPLKAALGWDNRTRTRTVLTTPTGPDASPRPSRGPRPLIGHLGQKHLESGTTHPRPKGESGRPPGTKGEPLAADSVGPVEVPDSGTRASRSRGWVLFSRNPSG